MSPILALLAVLIAVLFFVLWQSVGSLFLAVIVCGLVVFLLVWAYTDMPKG